MIKFSKLADYAVVILAAMARSDGALLSAGELAGDSGLPEPTVAKVLKMLSKAGVIQSIRGAHGGYRLASSPASLSIANIVTAVDGPVALTACVQGSFDSCDYHSNCSIKGRWDPVNAAVKNTLENISLADMIAPQTGCFKHHTFMEERV